MNAEYQAQEAEFLDAQTAPARALWMAAAKLWDSGRDVVAAYQVDSAKHLDLVVPTWEDLPMNARLSFAESAQANDLHAKVSTLVAMVSRLTL